MNLTVMVDIRLAMMVVEVAVVAAVAIVVRSYSS